jgi:hypothetical protein
MYGAGAADIVIFNLPTILATACSCLVLINPIAKFALTMEPVAAAANVAAGGGTPLTGMLHGGTSPWSSKPAPGSTSHLGQQATTVTRLCEGPPWLTPFKVCRDCTCLHECRPPTPDPEDGCCSCNPHGRSLPPLPGTPHGTGARPCMTIWLSGQHLALTSVGHRACLTHDTLHATCF